MRATRESSRRNDEQGNEMRSPSKQDVGIQPPSTAAATILPPHLRTGDKISYYANNDFESVFIEEFLSHEKACNETIAKADIMNFTNLPGSTVHSHAEKHLIQQASKKSSSPKGCTFSSSHDHERLRLNELRKSNSTIARKGLFTPYIEANSKIARVLQRTKPKGTREDMQASQLNEYYKLVTRETSAAILLQSQCRRILATAFANRVAHRRRQVTKIQSVVRGFLARRLLKRIKEAKQKATAIRARLVRLFVARCIRRKTIKLEHDAAVVCQCAVRVFFAKRVANIKRLQLSWELNQQRWRALSTRLAWVDLRFNFYARQIQCIVRRKLAQQRVSFILLVYTQSAILIQSSWRRFISQERVRDAIYELSVDERCNKVRIIESERKYWKNQVEELTKPSNLSRKSNLEAQRVNLEKGRCEKYEQIRALESHYRDQLQLQQRLTAREVGGGWDEQVRINLADTRERITKAKIDLLFDVQKKLKSVVNEIDQIQCDEDEAKACLEHWSTWQEVELDGLWRYQRHHDDEIEEKEKRHSIVNEKMLWAVKFCVPSGKPDKRRPARPDKDVDDRSMKKVQKLVDATKANALDYQAAAHLANTFRPFQNMLERLNSLDATYFKAEERGVDAVKTPNADPVELTSQSRSQKHKRDFPTKLPWDLLDKVRDEREEIIAKFGPKNEDL